MARRRYLTAMTTRDFERRVLGPGRPVVTRTAPPARKGNRRRVPRFVALFLCLAGSLLLLTRGGRGVAGPAEWRAVLPLDPRPIGVHPVVAREPAPAPDPQRVDTKIGATATVAKITATTAGPRSTAKFAAKVALARSTVARPVVRPRPSAAAAKPAAMSRAESPTADFLGAAWEKLYGAYQGCVAFVSDQLLPDAASGETLRATFMSISDRIESFSANRNMDFRSLGDLFSWSVLAATLAFFAALALCLAGPIYLSMRSAQLSRTHVFRLAGRR